VTFEETLHSHGLELTRSETTWLQVNVGLVCDLACKHCHLEAGPTRTEMMAPETVEDVIACARRFSFGTIDITGGAPELVPHLPRLVSGLAPLTPKLVVRTNLVALSRPEATELLPLYRKLRVGIVASLPSISAAQTDAQRGAGVWEKSMAVLQRLNSLGYGREGSGLELDIAANPAGAFLPVTQSQSEQRFRMELQRRHGIAFNNLFTFANVPLGRFRRWLECSGNLEEYLKKLQGNFNPCTLSGLMCCSLISVNWEGYVYDCDFNLAAGLPLGGTRRHISTLKELPFRGEPIAVGDHCFACTAGAGFTCGGSIAA
jgi:radical SAM/Cys-rich protein